MSRRKKEKKWKGRTKERRISMKKFYTNWYKIYDETYFRINENDLTFIFNNTLIHNINNSLFYS